MKKVFLKVSQNSQKNTYVRVTSIYFEVSLNLFQNQCFRDGKIATTLVKLSEAPTGGIL